MELALGKYVIPAPSPAEIDELMSLPEGTPVQRGEEIRHTIFELLVVIVEQDPPKLPENYFCNEFCQLIDMCLQVSFSNTYCHYTNFLGMMSLILYFSATQHEELL